MQITSVTITYGRKVNTGNYSSVSAEYSVSAMVDPEDDLHRVATELWGMAITNVKAQVQCVLSETTAAEPWLGLPSQRPE